MKNLCEKFVDKILDAAITEAIGEIISYVTAWCWNQERVQEMRRKFEELFVRAKKVNPTAQQSNTANLLRKLQNEAEQGKELLDGQPTPVNLSNAKERFERIRLAALMLNGLLLSNAREAGVHPKIKRPQFKPRYLRSSEAGVHPKIKRPQFKPRYLNCRTRFQVICSYNCY